MLTRNCGKLICAIVVIGCALPARAVGQDFRVESEVSLRDNKKPFSENLTLFANDMVYDFLLTKPEEITIFDPAGGKFVLLDPARKLKLTIAREDILSLIAKLKASEYGTKDPFLFAPLFNVGFDQQNSWVTLTSSRITYRVKGLVPKDPGVVYQYRRFADWYARLNATVPGNMPPFARIEMNKEIAIRGFIPEQVELTLKSRGRTPKKTELVSRHLVVWQLSNRDRDKIESAEAYKSSFRPATFKEYHGLK